jgi:hypothetical protein
MPLTARHAATPLALTLMLIFAMPPPRCPDYATRHYAFDFRLQRAL